MLNLTALDREMLNSFHESVDLGDSNRFIFFHSCWVTQLCLSLCDPTDCSTPGFPVLHYLLEFAQSYVHWLDDCGPKTKIRKKELRKVRKKDIILFNLSLT